MWPRIHCSNCTFMTVSCCQILSQSHVSCGYGMERPPPVGYQRMTRSCWGTKLSFLRRKSAAKPMGESLVGVGEAHLYRDSMTAHPSEHWKWTQALAEEAHSQHLSQALLITSSLFIRAGARETAGGRWRLGNGPEGPAPHLTVSAQDEQGWQIKRIYSSMRWASTITIKK